MVNNIYLKLLNDVDVQLSPTTASNNILIKTADNLTVDIIQPKRLVAIGESYEGLMFPVGSYEDYGMIKVNDDTGLIITNGVLEIEANRFVEKNQGVANKDKFLYVKPDGTVGLTNTGVPIRTSDLENDGEDGINPFITEEDIPTNLSQFANDMGYVLPADLPSKTSDLYNDSDFVSRNDSDFISRSEVPTKTSDLINDGEGDSTPGSRFVTGDDVDGMIPIQSISVNGDTQYPDQNKCVSLTIPTEYAVDLEAEISPNDYVMTLQLKSENGYIGNTAVIDLPLESMIVDGRYDSATAMVVLELQSGSEISFSVADLVAGLQTEITSTNKLDADLVDDSYAVNKFMTSAEKTKLAGIATGAEVNVQSDWNQTDSTADDFIKNKPNIPAGVVVDTVLNTTSSNPIANSAVATECNSIRAAKQDTLVSGTNIKTINNNSLLGSGNINIHDITQVTSAVNMWELSDGIYYGLGNYFRYHSTSVVTSIGKILVEITTYNNGKYYTAIGSTGYIYSGKTAQSWVDSPSAYSKKISNILLTSQVVNNLTSTETALPLSAAQGKALNDGKVDKSSTANQVYTTDSNGAQTTRTIKESSTFDDLNWQDSTNHHKIPDISTIAFWDGAYQSDKSSNLKYCAGGEIALKSSITPTAWQFATANTDAVQQGSCEFCKVGKIVHVYIDNLVVKSGVSGTGSGLVNLFTGLPTTNHTIIFIIPDQVTNSSNAIRAKLDGGTISLHWTDTASFGNTGVHHNLIFSYVEA